MAISIYRCRRFTPNLSVHWSSADLRNKCDGLTSALKNDVSASTRDVGNHLHDKQVNTFRIVHVYHCHFRVNVQNLPARLYLAESFGIQPLLGVCIQVIRTHFQSVLYSDLLPHMSADTLLALLHIDELSVESEEQAFEAVSRWVSPHGEIDEQRLKSHVPEMLKEVRLHRTDIHFRKRLLKYHPIFQSNAECLKLFAETEQWIGNAAALENCQCPFNQSDRIPQQPLFFFVFGVDQNEDTWSVLRYDCKLETQERVASMEPHYGTSFVTLGERIFAVGGQTDGLTGSTRVDEFIVSERRWQSRAPLAVRRKNHAATAVTLDLDGDDVGQQRLMLVCGGCFKEGREWHRLCSCEAYDPAQDRWYRLPDLRETRDGPAAVCLPDDNRVFVFGGQTASIVHTSVEYCRLRVDWRETTCTARTEDFWVSAAPMPTARSFLAAAPFRGRIIVAGGWDFQRNMNVVEVFSPPDANSPHGEWTVVAAMEQPRDVFTILTSASAVFALGSDEGPENTVEQFVAPANSVDSDTTFASWVWSSKGQMKNLKEIVGAVAVRI
nr:unnamed protein product [Spirometra erinaceieuropaei]